MPAPIKQLYTLSIPSYSSDEDLDNEVPTNSSGGTNRVQGYLFEPVREIADLPEEEVAAEPDGSDDDEPEEPQRTEALFWCTCGNCSLMPKEKECRCCKEIQAIQHRILGLKCIMLNPRFYNICVDIEALDTALLLMFDITAADLVRPIPSRQVNIFETAL